MTITDFTHKHIEQAQLLAVQNYEQERELVPVLPKKTQCLDLQWFAENGMGVVAVDGEKLVGFLCGTTTFQNAFRSTDAVGVFSPMSANGAVRENRAAIYARMYQAVGTKWVKAGASSHGICLYAHDKEAEEQLFRYGFGLRTIDAIRTMDEIDVQSVANYQFEELPSSQYNSVFPLHQLLNQHQCESPFFMNREPSTAESFKDSNAKSGARFFVAKLNGKVCAYLKILKDGETFIVDDSDYIHIGGAFCLPEHRGQGIYPNLLNHAIRVLKAENYSHLGVDFESINPTAWGFWLKYFSAYTHGVVRRIDEHIFNRKQVAL